MRNDAFESHRGGPRAALQVLLLPPKVGFQIGQRYAVSLALLVSYLLFLIVFHTLSFTYHNNCDAVSVGLLFLGVAAMYGFPSSDVKLRATLWRWLPLFSTAGSVVLGAFLGETNYAANMRWYFDTKFGHAYTNVLPYSPARAYADAGVLRFSADAFVDDTRSVGVLDLEGAAVGGGSPSLYCAAPVLSKGAPLSGASPAVTFWAVGKDCCDQSARMFLCGQGRGSPNGHMFADQEAFDRTKTATLAMFGRQKLFFGQGNTPEKERHERGMFLKAVKQANSRFALPAFSSADQILLLNWNDDVPGSVISLRHVGILFFWGVSVAVGMLYAVLAVYLKPASTSPANPQWRTNQA